MTAYLPRVSGHEKSGQLHQRIVHLTARQQRYRQIVLRLVELALAALKMASAFHIYIMISLSSSQLFEVFHPTLLIK